MEVLRASELGLIRKWFRDTNSHEKKIYGRREIKRYTKKPISFNDLYPAFVLWAFGIFVSVLVFIYELFVYKKSLKLRYIE